MTVAIVLVAVAGALVWLMTRGGPPDPDVTDDEDTASML